MKADANILILNLNIMDLTKRKEELEIEKKKLEQIKADAHKGIIAINVKLRKLESVTRDAEELFTPEHQPDQTLETSK